ncbi:MAG: hypothetical protein K1X74_11800 [Pirellulales bacterium]|nr:hypothetical protein [Pirellulales bacterium]
MTGYFRDFGRAVSEGWNRFWFTPSDPLPLCVVRLLSGCLALYYLATLTPDLQELFGPKGLLLSETVREYRGDDFLAWSYLDYLREPTELLLVHLLGLTIVALYTVGAFARITSVLALVVMLSYFHRAPLITTEFEPLVAMMMFYVCLGPCGRRLSIDAWRRGRRGASIAGPATWSWAATVATRLLQIHLSAAVLMMALAKLRGDVWWTGEAMWWLLSRPESRLVDLTGTLYDRPLLYTTWTHVQVIYEMTFAILVWNRWLRPLLVVVGWLVWPLLAVATSMCTFAVAMMAASCIFLPPEFFGAWLAPLRRRG